MIILTYLLLLIPSVLAAVQTHDWTLTYKEDISIPDVTPRRVISINNQWPPPNLRLNKGDTLKISLKNDLEESTALHFHGIFQKGSNQMDGPVMITQCPIPPGGSFTYEFQINQTGTYWYHSHDRTQYGDGLRGALVVVDPEDEESQEYEDDLVITLTDWYYGNTDDLLAKSKGHEPSIDTALFNDTRDVRWEVETDKTYMLRLINMGMSGSQYFYIEEHNLTIVEIDGVKVEPVSVDSINIATGQRYGVLLKTKSSKEKNYGMVSVVNMMMRKKYLNNWIIYDKEKERPEPKHIGTKQLGYIDDFELKPLDKQVILEKPTIQIQMNYSSKIMHDELFYTVNHDPFLLPSVPSLMTVLSGANHYNEPSIYGESTNSFVLKPNDVVEIIVNSEDHMRHPFHLHGHNFQVIARGQKEHFSSDADYQYPKHPMVRDTVNVPGRGFVVLRFKADNPGVWFVHCHTDWHAARGLGAIFIEAPELIQKEQPQILKENLKSCQTLGIKTTGIFNGMSFKDWTKGEDVDEIPATSTNTTQVPMGNVSFDTKVKVLSTYVVLMVFIAVGGAFYVNAKIKEASRLKRRPSIANHQDP